jgi:hypothetical protein
MVLQGDKAQVKGHFGPFGGSANLDARLVHGFASNVPWARKSFWTQLMERLGDVGHVDSHFLLFWRLLVSVQDRCTVCAKRTIGSEIALGAPDYTPR